MGLTNVSQAAAPVATGATDMASIPTTDVTFPSYSSWFKEDSVHEIERRALPEFFGQSSLSGKTPSQYMGYRNFMVSMYRQRPQGYLSITTCRRHLAGDVGSIVRIHAFLEQWGLINYTVETKPAVAVPSASVKSEMPKAVAAVSAAAAASVSAHGSAYIPGEVKCGVCSVVCSTNYYFRSEAVKKGPTPLQAALGAVSVCPLCYAEGRYPAELASTDFIHIDTVAFPSISTQFKSSPWSDQEILSLLDAVEGQVGADSFDWDSVAAKVGRPKEQCLLQFLKLPTIETLENVPCSVPTGFPFANVENPVMSTIVFLASMVHPKVAAAAAKAAIAELHQGDSDLKIIATAAMGMAAAHASKLSSEEQQRLVKLRDSLIELQMAKIKAKLQLFEDLEKGLEADKKDVEQQRLQLFIDRFNLRKMMLKAQQSGTGSAPKSTLPPPPGASGLTKL